MIREHPIREESRRDFRGESEGSLPPPRDSLPDAGEAMNDFWSMSGNFIFRHHVEPRVKLYSLREESFPIPVKYIDVSRTTQTNLDGSRDLSDSWRGFTQFTLLDEEPPDGYMWSGWRLTKRQATSRPDHLWPELWTKLGRNAILKEKQEGSNEKPKLDNAGRLRGIYFIDLEDKEFKETKSEVIDQARTKGAKVHFASLMDICHLKNAELETKHQKYKGRVVLRGDIVKDDSGSCAVFTEQ